MAEDERNNLDSKDKNSESSMPSLLNLLSFTFAHYYLRVLRYAAIAKIAAKSELFLTSIFLFINAS